MSQRTQPRSGSGQGADALQAPRLQLEQRASRGQAHVVRALGACESQPRALPAGQHHGGHLALPHRLQTLGEEVGAAGIVRGIAVDGLSERQPIAVVVVKSINCRLAASVESAAAGRAHS